MEFNLHDLIARHALFVANHSGGKDSQAMLIKLLEMGIPREQLVVVHATLGEFEWPGALEHAQQHAEREGLPFIVAKAFDKAGNEKTFFNMVEHRFATRPDVPSWPSKGQRQCTSDLKRGPITRETLRFAKARGSTVIVNCEGLRADESADRKKKEPFKALDSTHALAKAGRTAFEWLPIHGMKLAEVWETIKAAGQEPHPAYASGNDRLSCVFCIFASKRDLANGARHHPDLFNRFVAMEQKTGYTMHMSRKPLAQLVAEAQAEVNELPLAA